MTYIGRQGTRPQWRTPTILFVELSIGQAVRVRERDGCYPLRLCRREGGRESGKKG